MKKIILGILLYNIYVACNLPDSGNKNIIKKDENVIRYDDTQGEKHIFEKKETADSTIQTKSENSKQ